MKDSKDKKDFLSPVFIIKYGLPLLMVLYFVISLPLMSQTTDGQTGAETSASVTSVSVMETETSATSGQTDAALKETVQTGAASTDAASAEAVQTTAASTDVTATEKNESETPQKELSAVNGETIKALTDEQQDALTNAEQTVTEDGEYSSMAEVAAYIHLYKKLPSNFISKTKAKDQGWIQSEGNLRDVLPGKSIGGGRFYNDDKILPEDDGRTYTECDIDYEGGNRNAKRIVFSNDGLVFYTEDHYETYIQLY